MTRQCPFAGNEFSRAGATVAPTVDGIGNRGTDARADVTANALARGEESSVVLLGPEEDYVEFWDEEECPDDPGAQGDAHAHGGYLQVAAEVDWDESDPNDAGRVHREACKRRCVLIYSFYTFKIF